MSSRAIIIANGELKDEIWAASYILPNDYVVAADGGSRFLARHQITLHALVGDMDSSTPEFVAGLDKRSVDVVQSPSQKNETDLELAIAFVLRQGFDVIRILGGFGGRIDHQLGNLAVLGRADLLQADVRMIDADLEVFAISWPKGQISGHLGDLVSLIPWGGDAEGVTTAGLAYPLRDETLYGNQARGISNALSKEQATVWLRSGTLLCVHQLSI